MFLFQICNTNKLLTKKTSSIKSWKTVNMINFFSDELTILAAYSIMVRCFGFTVITTWTWIPSWSKSTVYVREWRSFFTNYPKKNIKITYSSKSSFNDVILMFGFLREFWYEKLTINFLALLKYNLYIFKNKINGDTNDD